LLLAVAALLSVTVTCTLNGLPMLVNGVPVMAPVPEPMVNPLGSPVADQVYGGTPPVAVKFAVYAAAAVATPSVAGDEIVNGAISR